MSFNDFIDRAWSDHQKNPQEVAVRFESAVSLLQSASDITALAHLVTHVYAEHLGDFEKGLKLIEVLKSKSFNDDNSKAALRRFEAVLNLGHNSEYSISSLNISDQCRVLALTASAQAGLKKISSAIVFFDSAESLVAGLDKADPAVRSMAVTSNNIACALEEQEFLTENEKKLMLKAAHAALNYWKLAGTWLEVERAEYRLSQSYFRLRDLISSIKHANQCLTICEENKAPALEFFFAYESLCKIEIEMKQPLRSLEKMKNYFQLLSEPDQSWCEPILKQIESNK